MRSRSVEISTDDEASRAPAVGRPRPGCRRPAAPRRCSNASVTPFDVRAGADLELELVAPDRERHDLAHQQALDLDLVDRVERRLAGEPLTPPPTPMPGWRPSRATAAAAR